jgi:hypothetical protein
MIPLGLPPSLFARSAPAGLLMTLGDKSMLRTVMQELATGVALLLFVAMIATWAHFIAS